jgi:adenylate cyclase
MPRILTILIFFFLTIHSAIAQVNVDSLIKLLDTQKDDTARANLLNKISEAYRFRDYEKMLDYARQAFELSEAHHYPNGKAYAHKFIGLANLDQSKYAVAIKNFEEAEQFFIASKDDIGLSSVLNNKGAAYSNLGDDTKALESFYASLKIAEKSGDNLRISSALLNIGAVYQNNPNTRDRAPEYYMKSIKAVGKDSARDIRIGQVFATAVGNLGEIYMTQGNDSMALAFLFRSISYLEATNSLNTVPLAYDNIGIIYQNKKEYDKAIYYHQKALSTASKLDDKKAMAHALNGVAKVHNTKGDHKNALKTFKEVEAMALNKDEIGGELKSELKDSYEGQSNAYSKIGDYRNAYKYQTQLAVIKDSLIGSDITSRLKDLGFNYQLGEVKAQVELLKVDQQLKDEQIQRAKLVRNAILVGLGLVLTMIGILYRDYRNKIATNKLLDLRKAEIENLLLNILPFEVAAELQSEGYSSPRYYESVSVMFTDFVSFSKIAESLTPQQIVEELNEFFTEMDEIIDKYNLEKIKTIGDSYMCAGGIPTSNTSHPIDMVRAGLDIVEYLKKKNQVRSDLGMTKWEIRIGINTGSVVAGVVGKKKYAYDIWGNAVNIASRMESNGEPGMLNISADTYELIKDRFECKYRGKIYAKNVGEIDMYFVVKEIPQSHNTFIRKTEEPILADNNMIQNVNVKKPGSLSDL